MKQRENCTFVQVIDSRKALLTHTGSHFDGGTKRNMKCSRKKVKGTGFCKQHQGCEQGGGK